MTPPPPPEDTRPPITEEQLERLRELMKILENTPPMTFREDPEELSARKAYLEARRRREERERIVYVPYPVYVQPVPCYPPPMRFEPYFVVC